MENYLDQNCNEGQVRKVRKSTMYICNECQRKFSDPLIKFVANCRWNGDSEICPYCQSDNIDEIPDEEK